MFSYLQPWYEGSCLYVIANDVMLICRKNTSISQVELTVNAVVLASFTFLKSSNFHAVGILFFLITFAGIL